MCLPPPHYGDLRQLSDLKWDVPFAFKGVSFKANKLAVVFSSVWLRKAYHMQASKTGCEIAHPTMQACIGL